MAGFYDEKLKREFAWGTDAVDSIDIENLNEITAISSVASLKVLIEIRDLLREQSDDHKGRR